MKLFSTLIAAIGPWRDLPDLQKELDLNAQKTNSEIVVYEAATYHFKPQLDGTKTPYLRVRCHTHKNETIYGAIMINELSLSS